MKKIVVALILLAPATSFACGMRMVEKDIKLADLLEQIDETPKAKDAKAVEVKAAPVVAEPVVEPVDAPAAEPVPTKAS